MIKIILSVMLLLMSVSIQGQTLNYTNILCGSVRPAILISDADGNFYASGTLNTNIDFNPGSAVNMITVGSRAKMYIAKYDSLGAYQWAFGVEIGNTISAPEAYPIAMAVDNSGSVYITGIFNHNGCDMDPGPGYAPISLTTTPGVFTAYFYAKYSSSGQYIYAYSFGQRNRISGLVVDQFANVYLSGSTNGTDVDPGPNVYSVPVQGSSDQCVIKLDSAANFMWVKVFNSSNNASPSSKIIIDNDGNLIIGGRSELNMDFDPDSNIFNLPVHSIYISKYDSTGSFIWAIPIRHWNVYLYSLTFDSNNNIYIGGDFIGQNNDFDPNPVNVYYLNSNGLTDSYVAKYTPGGELIWAFSLGGSDYDASLDISFDIHQNCYVTGIMQSDSIDFDPGPGTFYLNNPDTLYQGNYTAVYDSTGAFIKAFIIKGSSLGYPRNAQNTIINGNELVVAGAFSSPVDFDPGPGVTGAGGCGYGGFITKYGTQFVGVEEAYSSPDFDVYPNPSKDQINIRFEIDYPTILSISLLDMTGRTYFSLFEGTAATGMNTITFSVSELPKGIYLIKIDSENGRKVQKVVVM